MYKLFQVHLINNLMTIYSYIRIIKYNIKSLKIQATTLLVYLTVWLNTFQHKIVQDLALLFGDIVMRKMINDRGAYILMLLDIHFTFVSHKSITFVAVNSAKKYIAITVIAKCSINACPMYTRRIGTVNNICHKFKKKFCLVKNGICYEYKKYFSW